VKSVTQWLIIVICTIFGCVASAVISYSIVQRLSAGWRELANSPSRITEIVGATYGKVYVKTDEGYFVCDLKRGDSCWSKIDWPIQIPEHWDCGGRINNIKVKSLPDHIIDQEYAEKCQTENVLYQLFALSDNGKLFVWDYQSDVYRNLLILCGGTFIGGTFFLVLSLSTVFILINKKNK
jgi:hypothetical protein